MSSRSHGRRPVGRLRGSACRLNKAGIGNPSGEVAPVDAHGVASHHLHPVAGSAGGAGEGHLPPIVKAMQADPPFRQGIAVFIVHAVNGCELIVGLADIGKGLVDIEEIVAVKEMDIVLGIFAAVVKTIVCQQHIAVHVHRPQEHVVEHSKRRLPGLAAGELVEDGGIEGRVDGGMGWDDMVLPALQFLNRTRLAPGPEFINMAILKAAADKRLTSPDISLDLRHLRNHGNAIDIDAQGMASLVAHQGQMHPLASLEIRHLPSARASRLFAADANQVNAAAGDAAKRIAVDERQAEAVAVIAVVGEKLAVGLLSARTEPHFNRP